MLSIFLKYHQCYINFSLLALHQSGSTAIRLADSDQQ